MTQHLLLMMMAPPLMLMGHGRAAVIARTA